MKNLKIKPADCAAADVTFGVELETQIPATADVTVGAYHGFTFVRSGKDANTGEEIIAPQFEGKFFRADRDGSIQCEPGFIPCEFVSPVLRGDSGVNALINMVDFINRIGGKVNKSCGLHVTVGIKSVIGSSEILPVAKFVHKLTSLSRQNAWAIYAQTGTDRHTNQYAHQLRDEVAALLVQIERAARNEAHGDLAMLTMNCGRGMVNLKKAFGGENGAIEFRAFAGTLNVNKVLHHVATSIGLMRRAHVMPMTPNFQKKAPSESGVKALRRMWRVLGWAYSRRAPVAYGLFGLLHSMFPAYYKTALEMAEKFDERFPNARL